MAFGRFLDRLLGRKPAPTAPTPATDPPGTTPAPAPQVADISNQGRRAAAFARLHREEILDARKRLCGYRFSLTGQPAGRGPSPSPTEETADLLGALADAGIQEFASRRLALIPVSLEEVEGETWPQLLAPHTRFVLNGQHGRIPVDALEAALIRLKAQGARVALENLAITGEQNTLLTQADLFILPFGEGTLESFEAQIRAAQGQRPDIELLTTGVSTWAEQRYGAARGATRFMGPFVLAPEEEASQEIDQSRLAVIELLNLIRRQADVTELTIVAKRDPGIAIQLLALANSPAAGLSTPVSGIDQAIIVLGREMLYRWLTVSLFRVGSPRARDEALLELALSRARFLETLPAPALDKTARDELFLVGMLSLVDLLLGQDLPRILSRMTLAPAISQVLLESSGPYGRYLALAIAQEKGRFEQAAQFAQALGIDPDALAAVSLAALAWTEESLGNPSPSAARPQSL